MSDCSPVKEERELGLDRREFYYFKKRIVCCFVSSLVEALVGM